MKILLIIYSIIFLLTGCSIKNDTPTKIDKKEVELASPDIQFRETFVCFTDGERITIENTSKDKLTEEEADAAFLKGCEVRHLDPKRCYRYNKKIVNMYDGVVLSIEKTKIIIQNDHDSSLTEYKNFKQFNPMIRVGKKVQKGYTLGRAIAD